MSSRDEFDIRLAFCFAAVAEERSFTRAAKRLNVAQPSVSEQVRRLEEQVGFPLFVRSSRKVELTPEGESFLALALQLVRVNDEAKAFIRRVRRRSAELLRIGAPPYSAEFEERTELIGRFMAEARQYSLDIVHAWNSELVGQLRRSEIDLAFVQGEVELSGLDHVMVHRSYAHFLVPAEGALASLDSIASEDLRGHSVVATLPHVDPATYNMYYKRFADCGALLVPTPEHHARTMEQFARTRRLVLLRFGHAPGHRRIIGDMMRIPSREDPPIIAEMSLVRRTERGSTALERFWQLAKERVASATPMSRLQTRAKSVRR
jgi:DNA-binding transcriptional LysR family regulator